MRTGLAGRYQLDNAAMVLAACELLNRNGARVPEEAIRSGLAQNRWPGRLEIVSTSPFVIIDGAHNLAAARNLARLSEGGAEHPGVDPGDRDTLDDKPYREILETHCCRSAGKSDPDITQKSTGPSRGNPLRMRPGHWRRTLR